MVGRRSIVRSHGVRSCRVSERECAERILDPGPYADRNPAYQINPRTSVIVRRVRIKYNPFMQRYKGHLRARGIDDVAFQPKRKKSFQRNGFFPSFLYHSALSPLPRRLRCSSAYYGRIIPLNAISPQWSPEFVPRRGYFPLAGKIRQIIIIRLLF